MKNLIESLGFKENCKVIRFRENGEPEEKEFKPIL